MSDLPVFNKSKIFALDLEAFASVFSVGFMNWETREYEVFEVSNRKNDIKALLNRLMTLIKNKDMTITFNGMFYDIPVMHYFINLAMSGVYHDRPMKLVEKIYNRSQYIILHEQRFYRERNPLWIDVDLYKVFHYDNNAKRTSLKKVEVFLNMPTVMELPHDFHDPNLSDKEVEEVVDYMHHDVLATLLFADYAQNEIVFRFSMLERFGIAVLNYSDSKIGSEIMNKELIDKMGYDSVYKIVNGKREPIQTEYPEGIKVKDLILPYIKFETDAGKAILEFFESQTLYPDPEMGGTGMKGVFDKLDLSDIGNLKNHCHHELTNTEIRKQNTRKYIDSIVDGSVIGEYDRKGYPILPYDKDGKPTEDYQKMNTYRQKYWDHLQFDSSSDRYIEKWKKYNKKKDIYNYCKETFELPNILKHLNVVLGNIRIDLGVGGAHQSIQPGIYKECDKYAIYDCDFQSYYPSLSIENFLAPKHYDPQVWVDTYGGMKEARLQFNKKTHPNENKALKLSLNSTYGNSGNKFSPIRDPAYTVSTCINGQLGIIMLCEILQSIDGLQIVSTNTDGVLSFVPKSKEDEYFNKCEKFSEVTKLILEFERYEKLLHRDVNNYLYK